MDKGFIKLWRKFGETSFYKNSHCVHLAIHLLLDCTHEPKKFLFNGEEEICERGQTITGLEKLSEDTGISIQSLRTSLHVLVNTGFLTSKSTNKYRRISICKYEEYQSISTSKSTSHQQATNRQLTANNTLKNLITTIETPIPDWVSKEVWEGFKDLRKKKNAPLTDRAIKIIMGKLAEFKNQGVNPDSVLDQSIEKGWTGVFPLKTGFIPHNRELSGAEKEGIENRKHEPSLYGDKNAK